MASETADASEHPAQLQGTMWPSHAGAEEESPVGELKREHAQQELKWCVLSEGLCLSIPGTLIPTRHQQGSVAGFHTVR